MTKELLNPLKREQPSTERAMTQIALLLLSILFVVLVTALAIHQIRHSDPYVRDVLSLNGDLVRGHAIFQMNCSSCHGLYADGHVGPSLHGISDHKSSVSLIYQVTSGQTPPMPQFQPSPQEMADLLEYLESL